jgi:16S rRNA (guanine(527)-N(7))-methyltransferase RsmG
VAVDSTKYAYQELGQRYDLSPDKLLQLQQYAELLIQWNEQMNLTAICQPEEIVAYHFKDSLEITRLYQINKVKMLADVGTGAGFPALPLKIMYPELSLVLIEVSSKRITFLQEVINALNLQNVEIVDLDWRTFLRKTDYPIDLFVARASLAPAELIRIFKANSPYKEADLIYWASEQWQPDQTVAPAMYAQHLYTVGDKKRQYVIFKHAAGEQ